MLLNYSVQISPSNCNLHCLNDFVKTSVILTTTAWLVGCNSQLVTTCSISNGLLGLSNSRAAPRVLNSTNSYLRAHAIWKHCDKSVAILRMHCPFLRYSSVPVFQKTAHLHSSVHPSVCPSAPPPVRPASARPAGAGRTRIHKLPINC